ncbi:lysozyme inhibitor LprI family protein [Phenylobacterium sp.]|jgi:uncharacterized protein YecT (DUF1311 family)|uniref:lysozyme inhibitor LprI family protein n=1 Tax=Phenylobacterium sp. TaxID=1871053 RepID=UPI002F4047B5
MAYVDRPDPPHRFGFTSYADDTPRFEAFDDPAVAGTRFAPDDADWEADWDDPVAESVGGSSDKPGLIGFLAALLAGTLVAAVLAYFGTGLIRSMPHRVLAQPAAAPAAAMTPQGPGAPALAPGVSGAGALPNEPSASASSATAGLPLTALPPPAVPQPSSTTKPHRASQKATARHRLAPLDCARPASSGQRMVCRSPGLRAADRRMTRAYAAALAAGAPPRTLRRDQVKWLKVREAAARRSSQAVEAVYSRRIEALDSRPYAACAAPPSRGSGLTRVTRWLLSVPGKIVSPKRRAGCG